MTNCLEEVNVWTQHLIGEGLPDQSVARAICDSHEHRAMAADSSGRPLHPTARAARPTFPSGSDTQVVIQFESELARALRDGFASWRILLRNAGLRKPNS
jgi:hypothetical protein